MLLRDILSGDDAQVLTAANVITAIKPDIILLTRFDFDLQSQALIAFVAVLSEIGVDYPYQFSRAPNTGVPTGMDVDRDGYLGSARDAQGYGDFAGQGGMALLSRYPIRIEATQDFSQFLWRDLPGARLPILPDSRQRWLENQRLSSVAHWDVPISMPDGSLLHLLAYHATTPAFDGPEDRNGLRNYDETTFWLRYLEGRLPMAPPSGDFIVLGDANLDPQDGEGLHQAIRSLLDSEFVQDTAPRDSGYLSNPSQGGVNVSHNGDPALDTANWQDIGGPGNLRVDYVLPSKSQNVIGAGVEWPAPDDVAAMLDQRGSDASWHGLVWVDLLR